MSKCPTGQSENKTSAGCVAWPAQGEDDAREELWTNGAQA